MHQTYEKVICILLCAALAAGLLAGCGRSDPPDGEQATVPTEETVAATEETTPAETTAPAEETEPETTAEPEETTFSAPTEEPTEEPTEPEASVPYLETVKRPDQPIFDGPGYDYGYVGTVEVAGVYTIMEERRDYEGNLWGRLKSGLGWIDLTDSRAAEAMQIPVSAGFADDRLLKSGNYHECVADTSEYAVKIAFRAYETLTDVTFSSLQFDGEEYVVAEGLCSLPELTPDQPLVVWVSFPGDMSCYGLAFKDSDGVFHRYTVSISGRNGTIVFVEADS